MCGESIGAFLQPLLADVNQIEFLSTDGPMHWPLCGMIVLPAVPILSWYYVRRVAG